MNTKSLSYLKGMGFTGPDVDLAKSLFEYGIAWMNDGFVWRFIYAIDIVGSGDNPTRWHIFDYCNFPLDAGVEKEWGWVKFDDIKTTFGYDDASWSGEGFAYKVSALYNYYGAEEIFGSSYSGGFIIMEDEDED